MAKHPEHEEKNVASDSRKPSDGEASDDSTPSLKADGVRTKLKLIAKYAMHSFAPVLAVLALIIAVIAFTGNQSSQAQLSNAVARIDSINSSLSASKGEMEKLKGALVQEKAQQEEERKKLDAQDEQATKIILNVTHMQIKMKITPTLEEQLMQPASASAVNPSVVSAATPAAPAAILAAPATAAVSTGKDKKPSPQVQAIKNAIDTFNK